MCIRDSISVHELLNTGDGKRRTNQICKTFVFQILFGKPVSSRRNSGKFSCLPQVVYFNAGSLFSVKDRTVFADRPYPLEKTLPFFCSLGTEEHYIWVVQRRIVSFIPGSQANVI